jgi:hypothetical protein
MKGSLLYNESGFFDAFNPGFDFDGTENTSLARICNLPTCFSSESIAGAALGCIKSPGI